MRRAQWITSFLASTMAASGLVGCGGKSKSDGDYEPPAAVAANTTTPVVTPKVEPPAGDADPKAPGIGLPQVDPKPPLNPIPPKSGTLPLVPMPPLPAPKDPVPKDPPTPFTLPPMPEKTVVEKKDPDKPFEWPTSMYGRPMSEYIKDISDNDPAVREQALRTIANFGPPASKAATKAVIFRMSNVNETDTGVRAAAFEAIGNFALLSPDGSLETEADTTEAIRLLVLSLNAGGATRLHAVVTLGSFGPRAASAIPALIGLNMTKEEKAYETRRAIATTLGTISFIKDSGPSVRALHCLSDVLVHDSSAAVRMAAYQSIVLLGPPYLPAPPAISGRPKPPMKVDEKAVESYVKSIKTRLLPYKAEPGSKERESPTGLMERSEQVEIWTRLALMRLDVKEITDENISGITKYAVMPGNNSAPKLVALDALKIMGDAAARKINDVVRALEDEDPRVVTAAVIALVAMGKEGKPAIEFLEKLKNRGSKKEDKDAKDLPKEYYADLATRAIKAINEAKPPVPPKP